MIWYERQLNIHGMPDTECALIVGSIDDNTLKISIEYYKDDNKFTITELSKPMNMWQYQELINEEVRDKYWSGLEKIRNRHENKAYDEWLIHFKSLK
jgi:hypothetical protein